MNFKNRLSLLLLMLVFTIITQVHAIGLVFENGFEKLQNQVILGHLSNAQINAYKLDDLNNSIEATTTSDSSDLQRAGLFELSLSGIANDEWVLVLATGGNDLDADDDGIIDAVATVNNGTIYALAKAQDWRAGGKHITALTDISWRYTKNIIDSVAPAEIVIRVNELAKQLILFDINGDALIDYQDVLSFIPNNQSQRAMLNFDFQVLHNLNTMLESYILAVHSDAPLVIESLLNTLFQHTLTMFPAPDNNYNSIKIKLALFGDGSVTSSALGLSLDSDTNKFKDEIFVTNNPTTQIILTASPKSDTHIMNWRGCDVISNDLTQCTITLNKSHNVLVSFGIDTVTLTANVLDLSRATNTVSFDQVDVVIHSGLTDLITDIAQLQVNDFVVGETASGFLRKVTAINQVTTMHYILTTEEAELADVIENGTGVFYKQMVNSDLVGYTPASTNKSASVSSKAFNGIDGVKLIPSDNPDSTMFTLQFGEKGNNSGNNKLGVSSAVTLYDDGAGGKVIATGALDVEIALDTAFAFRSFYRLKYYRFVADVDITESLDVEITTENKFAKKVKIGDIQFAKIIFYIGPVPIWVTSNVNFYLGAEGEVSASITTGFEAKQNIKGGIIWDYESGWDGIADFTPSWDLHSPTTTIKAELKFYTKAEASLRLYGVTGPALPLEGYLKYSATASVTPLEWSLDWRDDPCFGSVHVGQYFGILSEFKWDMSGDTKIGRFLHLGDLEDETTFTIFEKEWPIIKEIVSSDPCVLPPHLEVSAVPILATVNYQAPHVPTTDTTVTLTNIGADSLAWASMKNSGPEITVTPANGTIAAGQSTTVQIAVDTSTLPVGIYTNPVLFENLFNADATIIESGTEQVPVTITVLPVPTPGAPIITSLTSTNPGLVDLTWSFDPTIVSMPITRYFIYSTLTPNDPASWQFETQVLANAPKSLSLSGYTGGSTVAFSVLAFGQGVTTPKSSAVSVIINGSVPLPATSPLNDTGRTWGRDHPSGNNATCASNITSPQDCNQGRDATHNDDTDGHAGFSFTKLDEFGNPLAASATSWSCVRDNVTGLIWEIKTTDGGIHDINNTYRWGGVTHQGSNFGTYYNDWDILVDGSNIVNFCGFNNWRVPTSVQLSSIVDFGFYNPSIDSNYFPNVQGSSFWSALPYANSVYQAWYISFQNGYYGGINRAGYYNVMLVHSVQ